MTCFLGERENHIWVRVTLKGTLAVPVPIYVWISYHKVAVKNLLGGVILGF